MKTARNVPKVFGVVFVIALMSFNAKAKTVHKTDGQYLDMDGIVTTFTDLVRYDDDMNPEYFSLSITNWFGKKSAWVSGNTVVSWIYENQVTFMEGEYKVPSGLGLNPAAYIWDDFGCTGRYLYQDTGRVSDYGDKIYERSHVLDGFSASAASGTLIRPCDRPSDEVSHLYPVWRGIKKWTNDEGDVSFAYIVNEGFEVLPNREEWHPAVMWTTDGPRFKLDIKAIFPCYWKDDELKYYTRSIPYTVILVVWSDPRDSIPPGEEYYKKCTFSGTATPTGKSSEAYFSETINLGEHLQEGRYSAYMEIRSPLSCTPPSYCTRDFEVRPKNLSVKVNPKKADWQAGSLTLHWRDADLSDDVSDEASNSAIAASGKHFNIWRANGEGYADFVNAKLVGVNQADADACWTDKEYADSLGVWPAKYWVQVLSGNEQSITAKPSSVPTASCVAGRRFAILCGFAHVGGHSHTSNEVEWVRKALGEDSGRCAEVLDRSDEKGTIAGIHDAWTSVSTNALPGDTLFFYISTHGGAAANNQEESNLEVVGDPGRYTSKIMREDLGKFPATTGVKVINIIDTANA